MVHRTDKCTNNCVVPRLLVSVEEQCLQDEEILRMPPWREFWLHGAVGCSFICKFRGRDLLMHNICAVASRLFFCSYASLGTSFHVKCLKNVICLHILFITESNEIQTSSGYVFISREFLINRLPPTRCLDKKNCATRLCPDEELMNLVARTQLLKEFQAGVYNRPYIIISTVQLKFTAEPVRNLENTRSGVAYLR